MIDYADIIVDLQAGDTGKGKIANHLMSKSKKYTHVVRYNGGGNAGHTFYYEGKKIITHYIPIGVIYKIKSIIGPGCVVNPTKLFEEINDLETIGFPVRDYLKIDKRVHIVQDQYVEEDMSDSQIGTTKTGNGPTYRNKYNRTGLRAENCDELKDFIVDTYDEFHGKNKVKILFEGAQGFELDIDWGDYPFVTSSHCTAGSALMNGVPPQKVREVYGVAKAYRTYVGAKSFEPNNPIFEEIREKFGEFGATTGRPRQINWLDLDTLIKATNINGATIVIFNKFDVLKSINTFELIYKGENKKFDNEAEFVFFIKKKINKFCPTVNKIVFSESPYSI